jgi:ligand-binding SRPBCC domain-containing protein
LRTFIKSIIIDAPVGTVFAFHEREDALTLLTPGFPPVKLISKTGAGIETGTRIVLRVAFMKWIAVHTEYHRNELFIDVQVAGPFASWTHRHEFEEVGDGRTRLTDRIEYELPGGAIVTSCFGWAVNIGLGRVFNYRHRITRQYCES